MHCAVFRTSIYSQPSQRSAEFRKKLRLILDLSGLNFHLFKFPVIYEGLDVLREYIKQSGYLIKFDLRSGYHHIDIFHEHQTHVGFAWTLSVTRVILCLLLPFGLSSACNIFTKVMREVVRKWQASGIIIVMYLDDCIATNECLSESTSHAFQIKSDLQAAGFSINEKKI